MSKRSRRPGRRARHEAPFLVEVTAAEFAEMFGLPEGSGDGCAICEALGQRVSADGRIEKIEGDR